MDVGIGLPAVVPGAPRDLVLDWARRADAGPFSSVGVVDRLNYDNWEPLVALTAAAAVTRRVRLVTSILISPLREVATLAKQIGSLDTLSEGRVTLGVGVGARRDDYDSSEMPYHRRGDRLSEQLIALREHWTGDVMGPGGGQPGGPPLLVGGASDAALARMARHADGYVHGGGPPRAFARAADVARAAWSDHGRPGEPELWGMAYFALGDDKLAQAGRDELLSYYAFTGAFVKRIAEGLLTTPLAIRELLAGYADAGCTHVTLFPAVADEDQVERLAEVVAD